MPDHDHGLPHAPLQPAAADAAGAGPDLNRSSVYRLLVAEVPQWACTLHAAVRSGEIALTPSAMRDFKALALAASGAGEAAWKLLHLHGDAALRAFQLEPGVASVCGVLRLMAQSSSTALPDARLVAALCDDEGGAPWRRLSPATANLPAEVLAAIRRVLHRQRADLGEADIGLRWQLGQVVDWACDRRSGAGRYAGSFGWSRLVGVARAWAERNPGVGPPAALPLRLRARHLEAVQLCTAAALARESRQMLNCLDGAAAAQALRRPDRAFYSIRARSSRRTVADLEVAYWPRARRWAVEQLKGPANVPAPPDVRAFARALCVAVSPRWALRHPKALPAAVAGWTEPHPEPGAARLAARFALMLTRRDPTWIAPFITRASRYVDAQDRPTVGDALLAAWSGEFGRPRLPARRRGDGAVRLLRLPSDPPDRPHCLFDLGTGARAIAMRADRDGRLRDAVEVADRSRIAHWLREDLQTADASALPLWRAAALEGAPGARC